MTDGVTSQPAAALTGRFLDVADPPRKIQSQSNTNYIMRKDIRSWFI